MMKNLTKWITRGTAVAGLMAVLVGTAAAMDAGRAEGAAAGREAQKAQAGSAKKDRADRNPEYQKMKDLLKNKKRSINKPLPNTKFPGKKPGKKPYCKCPKGKKYKCYGKKPIKPRHKCPGKNLKGGSKAKGGCGGGGKYFKKKDGSSAAESGRLSKSIQKEATAMGGGGRAAQGLEIPKVGGAGPVEIPEGLRQRLHEELDEHIAGEEGTNSPAESGDE